MDPDLRWVDFLKGANPTTLRPRSKRAIIRAFVFIFTAIILLCLSLVIYWIFYYNFIPSISLVEPVHLQFGDHNPYSLVYLSPGLAPKQKYDVTVELYLPRTPVNLAAGNFMVDLSLYSTECVLLNSDLPNCLVARSRRPGIMTYTSRMVDIVNRIIQLPFFFMGWKHEAEKLDIRMMEDIHFADDNTVMPGMMRLELASTERIQIYTALVRFDARFAGLRWVMYRWRILSSVVFGLAFWFVCMLFASGAWYFLNVSVNDKVKREPGSPVNEDVSIKSEHETKSSSGIVEDDYPIHPTQYKDKENINNEAESEGVMKQAEREQPVSIHALAKADDNKYEGGTSTQSRADESQTNRRYVHTTRPDN